MHVTQKRFGQVDAHLPPGEVRTRLPSPLAGLTLISDRGGDAGRRVLGSLGKSGAMSALEPIPFTCPGCGTKYKIVLIDPSPDDSRNAKIKCVHCGVALRAMKGNALLRYFLRSRTDHNPADLPRRKRG